MRINYQHSTVLNLPSLILSTLHCSGYEDGYSGTLLDVPDHITAQCGTCFVVITGFNDNDNMMIVVELVVVFVVNFDMNKMRFRVMKE